MFIPIRLFNNSFILFRSNMSPKTKCSCQKNQRKHGAKKIQPFKYRVCNGKHPLSRCSVFRSMKVEKRNEEVRKRKHCFNHLAHNHTQPNCTSRERCRQCKGFHHSLLHKSKPHRNQVTHDSPRHATSRHQSRSSLGGSIAVVGHLNDTVLLPTACVKLHLPDESILEIRCLLNTGDTLSTILDSVVTENKLSAFTLNEEELCHLKLVSLYDSNTALDHTFRVGTIDVTTSININIQFLKISYI